MGGFDLAGDLVWVHGARAGNGGHRPQGGTPAPFRSLPAACFLLSFAAGEALVREASKALGVRSADGNAPLGLGSKGLVAGFAAENVPLSGRTRLAPRPGSNTRIHRWALLEGDALDGYLRDANAIRNFLAHSGKTAGAQLRGDWFARVPKDGLASMTLMLAEGMLQAAQDVAYVALAAAAPRSASLSNWSWVLPERTLTGRMPAALRRLPQFPLPR